MDTISVLRLSIVALALGGFSLAYYIRSKKTMKMPLVCPIGSTCDDVVNSDYSKLFGVPIELLGMLYYGLVALTYLVFAVGMVSISLQLILPILGLTIFAFLFSLYLTFVQAFFLKEWCTWCLISASLCTMIFILSLLTYDMFFL